MDAYAIHAAGDDAATSEEIASIKTFVLFPNQDNQYVTRADLRFEDGWPAALDIAVAGGGSMRFLFVGHSELPRSIPTGFSRRLLARWKSLIIDRQLLLPPMLLMNSDRRHWFESDAPYVPLAAEYAPRPLEDIYGQGASAQRGETTTRNDRVWPAPLLDLLGGPRYR